jgi:hypothetical protein
VQAFGTGTVEKMLEFGNKMSQKNNWTNSPSWVRNAPKTVPDTVLDTTGASQRVVRAQPPGQTHSTKALN